MDDFIEFVPPRVIETPCVNVCRIDTATRLCKGCARTADEIARWTSLSDSERRRVMADLPARPRAHQASARA
ncbi:MAG: DUF1289 domain-containing protein [Sphingomonas sp.]